MNTVSAIARLMGMALCASLAACASPRIENQKLLSGEANPEYRVVVPSSPDRPLILMAFSGGGTRASALSATVLKELTQTTYRAGDGIHALSDDVKLVSSVSGGSVTAGWVALNGVAGLDQFRRQFLEKDNMAVLRGNLFNPLFWGKIAFTPYGRINVLEDIYDQELFLGATLAETNRADRPVVVLNATDMAGGETFSFTPSRFDDICASFGRTKVSTGVAASAAFPILLAPVAFKNYQPHCPGNIRSAHWAEIEGAAASEPQVNLQEYRLARYTNDLRRRQDAFRDIRYVHLLDGGVADNLGIGAIRSALTSTHDDTHLLAAINSNRVGKLVVVVVNARSDPPNKVYESGASPGVWAQLRTVTSVPIDAASQNSQAILNALLTEFARMRASSGQEGLADFRVYGVTVDFDALPADTEEHRRLRDAAKTVPTSWTLTPAQLQTTETVGRFLMEQSACYRQLINDLGAHDPNLQPFDETIPCATTISPTGRLVPANSR